MLFWFGLFLLWDFGPDSWLLHSDRDAVCGCKSFMQPLSSSVCLLLLGTVLTSISGLRLFSGVFGFIGSLKIALREEEKQTATHL